MSTDLVRAAVNAADLCITSANKLVRLYKDVKGSDDYVRESLLFVEAFLSRTTMQVDFIKRVAQTLSEEHCRIQFEVFETLQSKLLIAVTKVESVTQSPSSIRKLKVAFIKDNLEELVGQLERWQRIFDPSWFLILRISNSLIDTELTSEVEGLTIGNRLSSESSIRSFSSTTTLVGAQTFRSIIKGTPNPKVHVTLSPDGLDWATATSIKFCSTSIIPRAGSTKRYLVDTMPCDSGMDIDSARKDAEALAKKLSQPDIASFGLPTCYGLVKRKSPDRRKIASLDLVFMMPTSEATPVTLRQKLLQSPIFSLTEVLALSRQLARAVSFIHSCDFVHKNIRPEAILLFPDTVARKSLGQAHLFGFDCFRSVNFHTLLKGDSAWERNLYRHPSRQGRHVQDKYSMQHDVYSLGVCLLEIGLWETFVNYSDDTNPSDEISPSGALGFTEDDFAKAGSDAGKPCLWMKDHLVDLARSKLPMKIGDLYTSVVVTCLTCLDEDNPDFGEDSDMEDEDGVLVGVRFINKVLLQLNNICF